MRYLHNLASKQVFSGCPWELTDLIIPNEVRANKKIRDVWINTPTTKHCVYSGWEGLSGDTRLKVPGLGSDGTQDEGNPPHRLYALVADFDSPMTQDEVALGFERLAPMLPTFYGRSLSGKAHLVWLFERALPITTFELAIKFLELAAEKLRLQGALPGLDFPAFINPARYYTSGGEWYQVSEAPLSYGTTLGWLVQASSKINYREQAYAIPLTVVREQLLNNKAFVEQWSDLEFAVGAQGPSWWVEGSESPKSAIVKETGMMTFSSHATKNFYTWGDLLGYSFVDQYKANNVGNAVDGIFYDGQRFWREITRGDWKSFTKDDILHFLKVGRGLKERAGKGEQHSELDLAYEFLIDHHNIEGAAPFVFRPNGKIEVNNKPFLNVHTGRVISPCDHKAQWGHPDHFPTISKFFGPPSTVSNDPAAHRFFKGGTIPLDTFISWLSYFYKGGYDLRLQSGHNLFLCGPVNIGKTFLNRSIIGALMNGFREAKEYLMGEDVFGAELFSVAHWVVDDGTMSSSLTAHRRWGEMVKRMAANSTFRYHEKFRTPQQVEWTGRVACTLNDDEESQRLLPDLERSILDKIMLFRITDTPTIDFPDRATTLEMLSRELPYFARFLLDWQTPEHCVLRRPNGVIDYRFGGVKPWHDPQLMLHANQSSRTAGFFEIIEDWKEEYFRVLNESRKPNEKIWTWRGSAFQLRKQLCANAATADALRGVDIGDITRVLAQLKLKGYRIESEDNGDIKNWVIYGGPAAKNSPKTN
jgi:hypothetical protein